MSVLLINPFVVFDGREDAFLALFDQTLAIFRTHPGFISTRLAKALAQQPPGERAGFTHVNIAEWDSADAYAEALRDPAIKRFGPRYAEVCTFQPALYSVIVSV
jgi:heme-degrading monooxygenase HmoA